MRCVLVVSVNIKQQRDYLNMDPTQSACLCVNEWCRRAGSFTTRKKVCSICFQPLPPQYERMNLISRTATS